MSIQIKIKNSSTKNNAPNPTNDLVHGELALNYNHESPALYCRGDDNSLIKLADPLAGDLQNVTDKGNFTENDVLIGNKLSNPKITLNANGFGRFNNGVFFGGGNLADSVDGALIYSSGKNLQFGLDGIRKYNFTQNGTNVFIDNMSGVGATGGVVNVSGKITDVVLTNPIPKLFAATNLSWDVGSGFDATSKELRIHDTSPSPIEWTPAPNTEPTKLGTLVGYRFGAFDDRARNVFAFVSALHKSDPAAVDGRIAYANYHSGDAPNYFAGDMYIGGNIASPKISLNSDGSASFAGQINGTTVGPSDQKYKENIAVAKPQLADVKALGGQLKNFDWNADAPVSDEVRQQRQLGLIAQEVEKACPGLVKTVKHFKQGKELTPETTDADGNVTPATYESVPDDYKAISHDALIFKLLGAVAELSAEVEALKAAA